MAPQYRRENGSKASHQHFRMAKWEGNRNLSQKLTAPPEMSDYIFPPARVETAFQTGGLRTGSYKLN